VHRIGPTGRAGRKGTGITLLTSDRHRDVTRLANQPGLEHGLCSTRPQRARSNPRAGFRPSKRPPITIGGLVVKRVR
jgi:superfamily II DNA/RNA helicase